MKKNFYFGLLTAAAFSLPLLGAEKIFDLSFDDYTVTPQTAKGGKSQTGFDTPDLQLRMYGGVNGRGNALNLGNSERLTYKMKGNFDPREGTVILWIAPQNWKISDPKFQLFFYAAQEKYNFRIAKTWANYITVNIRYDIPNQGKEYFGSQVQARLLPEEWSSGRYHCIAVTWNGDAMTLYIDGRKPGKTPLFVGNRAVAPTKPADRFTAAVQFPQAAETGTITIGASSWLKSKRVDPGQSTAFDQITIWDKALPEDAIRAEYEKIMPSKKEKTVNELTIPKLKATGMLTGDLNDPVWKTAARIPLLPVQSAPAGQFFALAWHDGKNLHVGFSSNAPLRKKTFSQHDDPLWQDDVFELILRTPKKDLYHYLVNGNGAVYDELNGRKEWNSKLKSAVHQEENGWTAELSIPLTEFDSDAFDGEFCAASRPGILYHLYRWGGSGREFGPAGKIRLGKTENSVQIDNIGELEHGKLKFTGFSSTKARMEISKDNEENRIISIDPGKFAVSENMEPGRQQVKFSTQGNLWVREVFVRHPLSLSFDFTAEKSELNVVIDLQSADDEMKKKLGNEGLPMEVSLKDSSGNTIAFKSFTATELKNGIVLEIPAELAEGKYQLCAKSGKSTASVPFRRPDLAPYKAKLGTGHTVPAPWTPVRKISDKTFEVWNRHYEFQEGPLPRQITHGGEKLLEESPVWKFNGKEIRWESYEIAETYPDCIVLHGKGCADKAGIEWRGELWFDGAYILRMKLCPDGCVSVSDFGFRYAVVPDAGRYAMNPEYVPWQNNKVEVRLGPGKGRKDNLLWLSGVEKGVCIWTESNANWVSGKEKAPLTAVREERRSSVQIQIIGRPVTLGKAADYTFVFMATPSRPFPKNSRAVNYGGYLANPYTTHQAIGWEQFTAKVNGDDPIHFNTTYPAYPDRLRKIIERYRSGNGSKLHYYTMPGCLCDQSPDYDYWSQKDTLVPQEAYSYVKLGKRFHAVRFCHLASDAPADYWTWTLDRLMKDFPGMGGLYFDCCSTRFCSNSRHGCSGLDVLGQPYFRSDALGLRNFLMRVYKVLRTYPDTSMMLHSHVQFIPFCHTFTDQFAPGENSCNAVFKNPEYPYTEEVSPEEYQTDYNSRKAGVAFCMILQNARAAGILPALNPYRKRFLSEPEFAIRAITPFLIHDVNIWDAGVQRKTIIRYWKLRRDIKIGDASRFIGYWEKDCPVKSGSKNVYCSVYEWKESGSPWRRVIAVGNFNREEKAVNLQVDWDALGIKEPAFLRELWEGKDVPVSDLAKFTIGGGHFAVFGVK